MVTYQPLDTDLQLSRLVLGYWRLLDWQFSTEQLTQFVNHHLDLGITTVDHADIYGNGECESQFGQVLKGNASLRQRLQIVSKCGIVLRQIDGIKHYNTDASYIIGQVEQSLQKLHCDYLDVLLIHRPDPLMQADEVAKAFAQLHQQGKVRYFGASNFTPFQFDLLQHAVNQPLITNQVELSPVHSQSLRDGSLDDCQRRQISPMAWSCLGGGRIFNDDQYQGLRDTLHEVAAELGVNSIEAVVYAWLMALPSRPLPIIGSGNLQRISQSAQALDLSLSRQQWFRIYRTANGHDVA